MADVTVQLPMRTQEETTLFGHYLDRFMAVRLQAANDAGQSDDAPFLMVHSEPTPGAEMKVVTFQEHAIAGDFSRGWSEAVRRLGARLSA